MAVAKKKKLNILEMRCQRSMYGVTRMDREANEKVQRRTCVTSELAGRVEQNLLRWLGSMERMEEDRLMKIIEGSDVRGVRLRERP